MRQLLLRDGVTEQVVWLPEHPQLQEGNQVTLRDSENPLRKWNIVKRYSGLKDKSKIRSDWNNNI